MSRLRELLRVATPSTRNTQHDSVRACMGSAQQVHTAQQADSEQWREFETLLAIVGPAYNTPAHEYAEIRDAARRDIQAALECYRLLANEK